MTKLTHYLSVVSRVLGDATDVAGLHTASSVICRTLIGRISGGDARDSGVGLTAVHTGLVIGIVGVIDKRHVIISVRISIDEGY